MPEVTPQQAAAIQKIAELAHTLYQALDAPSPDTQQILSAQQNLTAVVETAWTRVDNDANLTGHDKAIARLLTEAAIKELPQKIQDPANYPEIKHSLRLLKASLVLLQ